MDVAQLGLEVQSGQVKSATNDLNKFTNAAKVADAAADGLSASTRNAGASAQAAAGGFQKAAVAAKAQSLAMNDNVRRMGGSMSGLAAQFQDIGVTASMGMSPMLIALQQGTQIAGQMEMAMQGGATASGVFMQALRSLISPISIASIGLTALAAALLQMVNWSKLAATALTALAGVLDDIAPYAVAAAAGLALLYAPAIIGGIVSLIALLGRMAVAAVSAGLAMAAANPAGAFVLGVTAAVAAANIFRDEIAEIFGRDIVGDVKNAANFVINSFEAAFEDIKFLWSNFPAIIGAAVIGAANAAIRGLADLIQRGADMIDSLRKKVNEYLPAALQSQMIGDLGLKGLELPNPYAAQVSGALGKRNASIAGIMSQDRIGQFGDAITRGASAASSKLKELAKDLTTVDEKKKKGGGGKSDSEKYSDIVDGANRQIASLKAEQAALGLTEQETLKLQYTQDLLNQAQQRGITLTAAQKAELAGLAEQMASTEVATRKAEEALAFAKDATKGFISDLRQGLMNGEGFWKSFGNAASNVLDKIIGKIEDELVDALFSAGSATGGGGGLLGSLLGGVGSLFGFADGGYTGRKAANAVAGVVHGGEYVFSKKATDRIGVGNLERMHKGLGGISSPALANRNSVAPQSIAVQVTGVLVEQNGGVSGLIDQRARAQIGKAAPGIVNEANKRVVPTMSLHQMQKAGGDYRLA